MWTARGEPLQPLHPRLGQVQEMERLIGKKDPELGALLKRLKVSPTFYGFRWITLLMTQVATVTNGTTLRTLWLPPDHATRDAGSHECLTSSINAITPTTAIPRSPPHHHLLTISSPPHHHLIAHLITTSSASSPTNEGVRPAGRDAALGYAPHRPLALRLPHLLLCRCRPFDPGRDSRPQRLRLLRQGALFSAQRIFCRLCSTRTCGGCRCFCCSCCSCCSCYCSCSCSCSCSSAAFLSSLFWILLLSSPHPCAGRFQALQRFEGRVPLERLLAGAYEIYEQDHPASTRR